MDKRNVLLIALIFTIIFCTAACAKSPDTNSGNKDLPTITPTGVPETVINSTATPAPTSTSAPTNTPTPTSTPTVTPTNSPTATPSPTPEVVDTNIYVAPDVPFGTADSITTSDTSAATATISSPKGTKENPTDLLSAINMVEPGGTIVLLEGTYNFSKTILITENNSGEEGKLKTIKALDGQKVTLDFSSMKIDNANRGVILEGSYWHFYGITIHGAGDNGMLLAGHHNLIERCIFDGNHDTGLQISRNNGSYNDISKWPSYNYILNCTSRNNSDPTGENADGFAPKLTCGEGNVFNGCIAYNNVDDGWDCYAKSATGPIGVVTIINCIAARNGQTQDGVCTENSDGNGFKLGGGGIGTPHIVINCLAFENKNNGFTDNNNPSAIFLANCTAFNNNVSGKKYNFNVYRCKNATALNLLSFSESGTKDCIQNMSGGYIYYKPSDIMTINAYSVIDSKNKEFCGIKASPISKEDFKSTLAPDVHDDLDVLFRNADGSLTTNGYAELNETSKLYNYSCDGFPCGARFNTGFTITPETVAEYITLYEKQAYTQ